MTPDQTARLERIQTVDDVLHIGEDYGWSAPVTRAAIERYAWVVAKETTKAERLHLDRCKPFMDLCAGEGFGFADGDDAADLVFDIWGDQRDE